MAVIDYNSTKWTIITKEKFKWQTYELTKFNLCNDKLLI